MAQVARGRSIEELELLLGERERELASARTEQTATAGILRAISESPTDPSRVLQTIVETASRAVPGLRTVRLYSLVGGGLRVDAQWRASQLSDAIAQIPVGEMPQNQVGFVTPIAQRTVDSLAIERAHTVHIPDLSAVPADLMPHPGARRFGARTLLSIPFRDALRVIGVLHVNSSMPNALSNAQIRLLETFADQASIAIVNARLFQAVTESNAALSEALAEQTAFAGILRATSLSPTDASAVLQSIVDTAGHLVPGLLSVHMFTLVDVTVESAEEMIRSRAKTGWLGSELSADAIAGRGLRSDATWVSAELAEKVDERIRLQNRSYITPLAIRSVDGIAIERGETIHIPDLASVSETELPHPQSRRIGTRTMLSIPMRHGEKTLGVLSVRSASPNALSERQIRLLETFADQASIAIVNARLFRELQDRLEEQVATGDILRAIGQAPYDLEGVLEKVLTNAIRLCSADVGAVFRRVDDVYPLAVHHGLSASQIAVLSQNPLQSGPGTITGRAIDERRTIQIDDIQADLEYSHSFRKVSAARTMLAIPLLSHGEPVGAFTTFRNEVRPFTDRQTGLLETFADQAVIAIENARLFSEVNDRNADLSEALAQQTATAATLRAVSMSPTDAAAVLDLIVETAATLIPNLAGAALFTLVEGGLRLDAQRLSSELIEVQSDSDASGVPPNPLGMIVALSTRSIDAIAIERSQTVNVPDLAAVPLEEMSHIQARHFGLRTMLSVPMRQGDRVLGTLSVSSFASNALTEVQIRLLETFADQAGIAVANARLFTQLGEKSRQLEEASRHKSEFLANMSHELRTPLNAIIGFTEVLLERYFGDLNEKQEDYLKDVLSSGRHLLALINDILDLSKVEAGRMELELGRFDLGHALEAGIVMVKERAARKNITLELAMSEDVGRIEADERKLKQVVFNLLTNAVKFTPEGGRVTLAARRTIRGNELAGESDEARRINEVVEIAVSDTGVGIAEEYLGKIFEEFGQARNQVGQTEGTGLGLALVRRYVELHGGTVRVDSLVGQGSTFTVVLPVRHEADS